jgi:hypothetical protein
VLYWYNHPMLSVLTVINLLLCLVYKLNFIIGIVCTGNNIVFSKSWYPPRFQLSSGGPEMYSLRTKTDYCNVHTMDYYTAVKMIFNHMQQYR